MRLGNNSYRQAAGEIHPYRVDKKVLSLNYLFVKDLRDT